MEYVRAVRSGADCTAAASMALLGTRPPSPVGVDSGGQPLLYQLVATLQGKWEHVAALLVTALVAKLGETGEEVGDSVAFRSLSSSAESPAGLVDFRALSAEDPANEKLRLRKAAFSSPSQRLSILTSALQLMADQGEIFLSGDIAYLDPAAIT